MSLSFVDVETLGLDPERHAIWEVALVQPGEDQVWLIVPTDKELVAADSTALRLNGFYERFKPEAAAVQVEGRWKFARRFAQLTAGTHLVGASISFDALRLERFLRQYGHAPAWHYHLVDVEALVAGKLGMEPPWNSKELSEAIGVPQSTEKHTALADARWARDLYEAVFRRDG